MYHITIQHAAPKLSVPSVSLLRKWAKLALKNQANNHHAQAAEITIRIVTTEEMTELNSLYRQKKGPTNVLSFPLLLPEKIAKEQPLFGDIVICADVIAREAKEQEKSLEAHWAHMVVHGIFHLLGYDHETNHEAEIMEALEISVMQELGFSNPYQEKM